MQTLIDRGANITHSLRLVHTMLLICRDLILTDALGIIGKISNYLQCNLALCNSCFDLQLV